MRIIIAGAGEVGFHLAKMLSHESQDIVLIDNNQEKLEYASNHLDVLALWGNATSVATLEEAQVNTAALLIAVTSSESTNITTALIGKRLGARRTIARISNSEYLDPNSKLDFQSMGIDSMISPEDLAAKEISRLLEQTAFTDSFEFAEGKLKLIGVHLDTEAPILNKTISETATFNPDLSFMPVALQRNNKTLIPRGDTMFKSDDYAYFVTDEEGAERVRLASGKEEVPIKNVMILGGSLIGYNTARTLCGHYNVKMLEQDRKRCFELADTLPKAMIINGDGRNVDLLEEEEIGGQDAFIAVTSSSETNIMSCLVAKAKGVRKTIALVENMDYIHISQTIGIDCMINKKLIAASNIFRFIREGKVLSLANLHGVDAEILEFEVGVRAKVTQKPIKKLNFPRSAIIGGVMRNGSSHIVLGDFQIQAGDRVVVFCMPESIHKVESLFK